MMYQAKDETDHAVLVQTVTVTFESPAAGAGGGASATSVLQSTVAAAPLVVEANGTAKSTITVTLKDANGQPVSGKDVRLTTNGGSSVITVVYGTSNAQGKAEFTVTNLMAEQVVYTATDVTNQVTIAQNGTVTFESPNPGGGAGGARTSVMLSTITASPSSVDANGTAASTITVVLLDGNSQPVSGKRVNLTADGGSSVIRTVQGVSDATGRAVFTVTDQVAEQVTYSAKDDTDHISLAAKATVTFLTFGGGTSPGTGGSVASVIRSTVTASPVTVKADGTETSAVTVVLLDASGQPVSGKTVSLTADGGSSVIRTVRGVSDVSGRAEFTVTNQFAEQVTYSAKDETDGVKVAAKASVTFQTDAGGTSPGTGGSIASVVRSTVTASPVTVRADGTEKSTVTVVLLDTSGRPVSGKTVSLSASEGSSIIKTEQAISDAFGQALFTVTNRVAEQVVFSAKDVTDGVHLAAKATVTFQTYSSGTSPDAGSVSSVVRSTVKASPTKVKADGVAVSTITVTLLDVNNVAVSGKTVSLTADSGSSEIKTLQGITDAQGRVAFTVSNKVAEQVVYTAKDETNQVKIAERAYVTFEQQLEKSKPIKEEDISGDPKKEEVTVKNVPEGTKITIYDKDGKPIGEGTNPGPGMKPVVIKTPGIKYGDIIQATAIEPGRKESDPTNAIIDLPQRPIYEVATEWEEGTLIVTVKPKPGTKPYTGSAYLVIQGLRQEVPVFVASREMNSIRLVPMKIDMKHAVAGDQLLIVVLTQPDYTRSNVGLSLSDEKIEVVQPSK
ncbi:hypothetical protein FU659_03195 [Paenibacillus sp. N3.4]|nr:hypothetical protein FU659_03195 [Paenibacillus sp. N3.4]